MVYRFYWMALLHSQTRRHNFMIIIIIIVGLGVHQMGLFWSMKPAPYEPQWIRLFKRDASTPLVTTITAYKGTIDFEELYSTQHTPLVSTTINRWYMGKGVQKITVTHGRLRGSLFVPPGIRQTTVVPTKSDCDVIFVYNC